MAVATDTTTAVLALTQSSGLKTIHCLFHLLEFTVRRQRRLLSRFDGNS
jgi:hypothetical protein